jgi:hypothetical protein
MTAEKIVYGSIFDFLKAVTLNQDRGKSAVIFDLME